MIESIFELDELDRALIALLQEDARMSYQDIGTTLGVSPSTAKRRLERLVESGTIKLVAVPWWTALGLGFVALVGLSVDLPKLRHVARELAKMEEICFVALTIGMFDIVVEVVLPQNHDFVQFITDRVAPIEGVRDVQTLLIPEFAKSFEEYRLPLKPDPLYSQGDGKRPFKYAFRE